MKRRRSRAVQVERNSSLLGEPPRRRVESCNTRDRNGSEAAAAEEKERTAEVSRLRHPRTRGGPRSSAAQPHRLGKFAYLRDDAEGALEQSHSASVLPEASTVLASSPTSPQRVSALDDNCAVVTSPPSARSVTRGFSHLRESVFFALPNIHGNPQMVDSPRGSIILPLSTPPQVSASRSTLSSSPSGHTNLVRQEERLQNHSNRHHHHRRRRNVHVSGSDHSFLSTRSAVEYLNSTTSAGEVLSSRESLRSSQVTALLCSASRSTLGPLDLSPILKEDRRPQRRHRGRSPVRQPPLTRLPIDVPAAVATSTAVEGGRRSGKEALEELHRSLAGFSRVVFLFVITLLFLAIWGLMAAPLVMRLEGLEDAFVRHYVDSVSELQFIYKVPYMSLSTEETRQLYFRVLSETLERLERATSHQRPSGELAAQILYYKRMIRAYQAVRHRARLYARSRDRSRLQQLFLSPLWDVWRYGVVRHSSGRMLRTLVWEPSLSRLWTQLIDIAFCLRQDEKMICPSLAYLQEKQEEHAGIEEMNDTAHWSGHHDLTEVQRLKRLLEFISESFRRSNRKYNHMYTRDGGAAVSS